MDLTNVETKQSQGQVIDPLGKDLNNVQSEKSQDLTQQRNQDQPVKDIPQQGIDQSEKVQEKEYFSIEITEQSHSLTRGQCTQMISDAELEAKSFDEFQKYPFKPIAKYIRNKSYENSKQVRTPEALDNSLKYLKENFLLSILNDEKKIRKIVFGRPSENQTIQETNLKEKRLEKILTIIKKQSTLGFLQEDTSFNSKFLKSKPSRQLNTKMESLIAQEANQTESIFFILPEKVILFLESRLTAIRCQLYAQGAIFPRLTLELLKCEIFLHTFKQNEYSGIGEDLDFERQLKLVGLDVILDQNIKDILMSRKDFIPHYKDALIIAIFRTQRRGIAKLIQDHQLILENERLYSLLKLRLQIQRGNYQRYFATLSTESSALVLCLLLTYLKKMRQRLCNVLIKAKIDVKKGWLAFLLGLKINKQEQKEIINLNKNEEFLKQKYEQNQVQTRQKQLKNWIKLQDLFNQMILSESKIDEVQKL